MNCFESGIAAFVMPFWMADDDMALRHFDEAVASVMAQTDPNWVLVIVDDHTGREIPMTHLRAVETMLGPHGKVLFSPRRVGPGLARNLGIRAAAELGAPFILFLDADDLVSMLRGPDAEQAMLCIRDAWRIDPKTARAAVADLEAGEDEKRALLELKEEIDV